MLKSPKKIALIALAVVLVIYVGWVVRFELRMGLDQPEFGNSTLVIHTTRSDGSTHQRVLARLQDDDTMYVAVNHWPRSWYKQALANPNIQVTLEGETRDYLAVPVEGEEHDYLLNERFPMGFSSRFQMGFPPRYFLRLEPKG